ncbi:MAG: peptidase M64 [Bacteroidetes bacterium]|nr:peptidase M64 [Bacteroidota bacterium]
MKKILFILLLFISLKGYSQFDNYFENKTLRIDYFHSGNYEHEYYRPDELIEKDIWAGSKINLVDTFDYGKFRIMVYDTLSGKLIYSRAYSTLFAEWRTTAEGKGSCGNFSETMLIPFPKKVINVVFQSRDSLSKWQNIASQVIDTKNEFILKPKKSSNEIIPLHYSGDVTQKLDIAIIADGYTKKDIEKMKKDFENFKDYLLKSKPFDKNIDKINIWGDAAISAESGITNPVDTFVAKTILGTSFNTINSDRYLMTLENKTLHDQLSNVAYDQIIIMCNTKKYGGGGIYNFYCTAAAGNAQSEFLLQHEFGHAFAGLADEYYTSEVSVEDFYPLTIEPWEPNITTLVNFESKWKNMLDKNTPVPTPAVNENNKITGVYEGGGYISKGVYRPFIDCTMKSAHANLFCPVCKRAIQWMIDFYSK